MVEGLLPKTTPAQKIATLRRLALAECPVTLREAEQVAIRWAWRVLCGSTLKEITDAVIEGTLEADADEELKDKAARLGIDKSTLYRWRKRTRATEPS